MLYKVDASGNEVVLHTFEGGSDRSAPYAGVVRDDAGIYTGRPTAAVR